MAGDSIHPKGPLFLQPGQKVRIHEITGSGEAYEDADVAFTSENEGVVQIDPEGHIVAIGEGHTTVSGKAGQSSASIEVTVEAAA